jgi:hypothetical protein
MACAAPRLSGESDAQRHQNKNDTARGTMLTGWRTARFCSKRARNASGEVPLTHRGITFDVPHSLSHGPRGTCVGTVPTILTEHTTNEDSSARSANWIPLSGAVHSTSVRRSSAKSLPKSGGETALDGYSCGDESTVDSAPVCTRLPHDGGRAPSLLGAILFGHHQPADRALFSHGDASAEWPGARGGRLRRQW